MAVFMDRSGTATRLRTGFAKEGLASAKGLGRPLDDGSDHFRVEFDQSENEFDRSGSAESGMGRTKFEAGLTKIGFDIRLDSGWARPCCVRFPPGWGFDRPN